MFLVWPLEGSIGLFFLSAVVDENKIEAPWHCLQFYLEAVCQRLFHHLHILPLVYLQSVWATVHSLAWHFLLNSSCGDGRLESFITDMFTHSVLIKRGRAYTVCSSVSRLCEELCYCIKTRYHLSWGSEYVGRLCNGSAVIQDFPWNWHDATCAGDHCTCRADCVTCNCSNSLNSNENS